jgi:hypothetical protein
MGVDASGSLGVPTNPAILGWWAAGPPLGAPRGTAVIDGHVDTAVDGPGALFNLRRLHPGDQIIVAGTGKTEHFQLVALREYPKASLPSSGVFDQTVAGRLAIVTCGGPFNAKTRHYRDNIVAYAIPDPGYQTP